MFQGKGWERGVPAECQQSPEAVRLARGGGGTWRRDSGNGASQAVGAELDSDTPGLGEVSAGRRGTYHPDQLMDLWGGRPGRLGWFLCFAAHGLKSRS